MYKNGSKTMSILGEQRYSEFITPEVMKQLQEIFESNISGRGYDIPMLLQDVFVWGYISGVHGERSRRARKKVV